MPPLQQAEGVVGAGQVTLYSSWRRMGNLVFRNKIALIQGLRGFWKPPGRL